MNVDYIIKIFRRLFLNKMPLRKTIVFESSPDFGCNTYPVFRYIEKAYPEYKIVWALSKKPKLTPDGVDYTIYYRPANTWEKIKSLYYLNTCSAMVSSNYFLRKHDERQISLFLCHGSKTKRTKGIYEMGRNVDYIEVQSHFFDEIITYEYGCSKDQLVYLGYPRCDYLFEDKCDIGDILFGKSNCRYIVWLPTFRKQIIGRTDVLEGCYDKIGMPLVYSIEALEQLNVFLDDHDMHILFKPHPAQDISALKSKELPYIHVMTDEFIFDKGLQLYEIIAQSEALITDYSSVFFDYLLLDRPIATTTDDIEIWKEGRGFAFDLEALYDKATTRVSDLESLKIFIENVLEGIDEYKAGRREICELTNMYQDGESTKRVVDFLMEKLGEKK